jgi:hypothetical protein
MWSPPRADAPAGPNAASRASCGRRAGPGAGSAESWPRPSGRTEKPIHVSWSPRSDATSAKPAGQSTAPVVRLHGLCAALCLAPYRSAWHRLRHRDLRHHPSQAAQDRCDRAFQHSPHQDRYGIRLSGRPRLAPRRHPARDCGPGPRLAGMTRAAATRNGPGCSLRRVVSPNPKSTLPKIIRFPTADRRASFSQRLAFLTSILSNSPGA